MADQPLWLVQLRGMESVKAQVVPDVLGVGASFHLPRGTVWLEQESERVPYEHTFLKLQDTALPEVESVELIAELWLISPQP